MPPIRSASTGSNFVDGGDDDDGGGDAGGGDDDDASLRRSPWPLRLNRLNLGYLM